MVFNKAVFIDQSAFLAFIGHPEYIKYHEIINDWFQAFFKGEFARKYDLLVTSDYVVLSVMEKLFENKLNDNIVLFVKNLIRSSSIRILNVHEDGFTHACRNIETYYSIFKFNFSFTDISTLFLLRSTKINALLTINPLFHRLEYLIRLDFNPEKDQNNNTLFYDAIPDSIFKSEKESPFTIYDSEIRPEDAICLFEIELTQWSVKHVEVDNNFCVTHLQLGYEFENKIDDKKTESRNIPESIFKLEKLKYLDLSNVKISETELAIFKTITSLTNLDTINLTGNNLKSLPSSLKEIGKTNLNILI